MLNSIWQILEKRKKYYYFYAIIGRITMYLYDQQLVFVRNLGAILCWLSIILKQTLRCSLAAGVGVQRANVQYKSSMKSYQKLN